MVSPSVISTVLQKATQVATHAWEYGTVSEALLEWNNASLSIWHSPFPIPTLDINNVQALSYVKPHISTNASTLVAGDNAAGDPASLGIPALLIGQTDTVFHDAAVREADHLVKGVPRWENGAISHREEYPELWADFVYMAPPFLAYYAVAGSDLGLLKQAAKQCRLYADVLRQDSGLWWHIVGAENNTNDRAVWSTGNAWAAAGMSRVLATLRRSSYDSQTGDEQITLVGLIKSILDGAIANDVDSSGLIRNYIDDPSWWGEISGTSLLAATVFRVAVLEPSTFGEDYTAWAESKLAVVDGHIDEESGTVSPAVNPLNWHDTTQYTTGSPEGQAFVVLMHAAYRDWKGE